MSIEGQILIDINTGVSDENQVSVRSTRPLCLTQGFIGLKTDQVERMVGLMFSLCGVAQQLAAKRAIEQAVQQNDIDTDSLDTHEMSVNYLQDGLLDCETVREHLLKILGKEGSESDLIIGDKKLLQHINLLLTKLKVKIFSSELISQDKLLKTTVEEFDSLVLALRKLVEEQVLQHPLDIWEQVYSLADLSVLTDEQISRSEFQNDFSIYAKFDSLKHAADLGRNPIGFLPELDLPLLDLQLSKPSSNSFIAQPQWQGDCYETSSLSRQHTKPLVKEALSEWGNGLFTRCIARIQELVDIVRSLGHWRERLLQDQDVELRENKHLPKGIGLSQVEAARGKLVHRVEVIGDKIKQYQILAPTEWNFHPKGVLAMALSNLQEKNPNCLREQAEKITRAIDPCVGYQLTVK